MDPAALLPLHNPQPRERWFVVFEESQYRAWWTRFCRPGFRHCWAMRYLSTGIVLVIQPLRHRVEQGIYFGTVAELLTIARDGGARVLVVPKLVEVYDPRRHGLVGRGGFITCASILAYITGTPFFGRFTPWQLWKVLLRTGATEVCLSDSRPDIPPSPTPDVGFGWGLIRVRTAMAISRMAVAISTLTGFHGK